MIKFDTVSKVYPDGTVAIEDVTFTVEAGTTTVLVGPSGCGKTTTMKLVNRLEEPTEGTVYYEGQDVGEYDEIELRRNIGYVIQEVGLFDHMTVAENVATIPTLKEWNKQRITERVDELLTLMNMPPEEYRDQYPTELSGGQRQRVGVARALAADPDVLLMDEPFGALDPITRTELQDEFLDIQSEINTTILFVTHDIDEALKMGDKIAVFDVGEVIQYDTPRLILENPANEFVEDFLGENRALKQLQVRQVGEIMNEGTGQFGSIEADGTVQTKDRTTVEPLSSTNSAQTALSRLLNDETLFGNSSRRSLAIVTISGTSMEYITNLTVSRSRGGAHQTVAGSDRIIPKAAEGSRLMRYGNYRTGSNDDLDTIPVVANGEIVGTVSQSELQDHFRRPTEELT